MRDEQQRVNFGVTRTLPDLNRTSDAAKAASVASTACATMPQVDCDLEYLLMPPRNTPSPRRTAG